MSRQGARAVPSLTYLERHPNFSIGPTRTTTTTSLISRRWRRSASRPRARRRLRPQPHASAANIVPQGGLFWDGRADTLQDQAIFPLLDPQRDGWRQRRTWWRTNCATRPMPSASSSCSAAGIFNNQRLLIAEAMFAVAVIRSKSRAFIPIPASSTTGWRAKRGSARRTARPAIVQRPRQGQLRRLPSSSADP